MIVTVLDWLVAHDGVEILYDVDGARITAALVERWAAQLAMMEAIPFAGLAPEAIDFGPASRHCTPRFEALWRTVLRGTGAQWRYEHDRQTYEPRLIVGQAIRAAVPVRIDGDALVFCGGGKDSLASITLMKRAELGYATFAYSHADYGDLDKQHALIDAMLDAADVDRRHRMRAEDDIDDRAGVICAETPISLFYALPLMLQHHHRYLVLGNERSSNAPNLVWNREPVNHQWGKSAEASRLLNDFLRAEWISNGAYFSILGAVHDGVIVSLLRDEPAVHFTHSCNVEKPWCGRCAKCVYVRMQFAAYLDGFDEELHPENEPILRELLGLESHKPFECVGEANEARLALARMRGRGIGGEVAERLANALPPIDENALAAEYLTVHDDDQIPVEIRERVMPILISTASSLR